MKEKLIEEIDDLLKKRDTLSQHEKLELKPDYLDFKKTKAYSDVVQLKNRKSDIAKKLNLLASELVNQGKVPPGFLEHVNSFSDTDLLNPGINPAGEKLISILRDIKIPGKQMQELNICIPRNVPLEIRGEIEEDLKEMEACFSSGCFRAATILCGRVLETALHRKYYEATGVDMLEKNPGVGLGNLISKLKAKNISFDPGITQQIHLINQIRIFSVHKKQERFYPTKPQTQAMILYTCDILSKLFKKNDI